MKFEIEGGVFEIDLRWVSVNEEVAGDQLMWKCRTRITNLK